MIGKTVLISGAGIGGPTLAYWLKAAGFEPTVVEHAPRSPAGPLTLVTNLNKERPGLYV